MNKTILLILYISFFIPSFTFGQIPNQLNAQRIAASELAKKGITEKELLDKLAEKGVILNNVQNISASEAIRLQSTIEQAIAEIEAEMGLNTPNAGQISLGDTTGPSTVKRNRPSTAASDSTNVPNVDQNNPGTSTSVNRDSIEDLSFPPTTITTNTDNIPILVYGQELFKNKSIELYSKSENIKPPDTYVLGVGDVLNIHIFGRSKADLKNLEINPQGYIQPGTYPRIYVKGLTYSQAKKIISQNLANYYVFLPNEFEMTIDFSREIGVNIYGEAEQIGTFNIPAINTAINALVAAKGPNKIGSVRNIKLIRGKTVKNIDIYEFINNPAVSQDYYLEQNDILHIPVAQKVITVTGAVRRPMKYELLENEDLKKLIQYAAGLREDAYQKSIQIKRFVDDKEKIIDVPYRELLSLNGDFKLLGGDVVTIRFIRLPSEQIVSIVGRVETPGTYELIDGMRISDLLEKGQVRKGAKTDLSFLQRQNDDGSASMLRINISKILENRLDSNNIELRPKDRLTIYSLSKYVDQEFITAGGAIRQKVRVPYDPNKSYRVSDVILIGGGVTHDALEFGYIKRINRDNFVEKEYMVFNTQKAISDPGGPDDPILEPGDDILIYNDRSFYDEAFVSISGSVRKPDNFPYGPGLTLKDLVVLSGGFTMQAATNRIEIFRVMLDENKPTKTVVATVTLRRGDVIADNKEGQYKLMPFDQVQVRTVPDFELQQNVAIEGEVLFPGTYALIKDNETVVDLLRRSGGPSAEAFLEGTTLYRSQDSIGYIVFRMTKAIKEPTSWDNLILKQGDRLMIPKVMDFIQVQGATDANELYQQKLIGINNSVNVAFVPNKRAKFYVDEFAAGVAKTGSASRITVELPNGKIARTKDYFLFKVYPRVDKGSIVKVGTKPPRSVRVSKDDIVLDANGLPQRVPRARVNWSKVLSDAMAQTTAVLSFLLLIQNIK